MRPLVLLMLLLTACGSKDSTRDSDRDSYRDSDRDGVPDSQDCAPLDPTIHPGADEACDLVDSDCDGELGVRERDGDGDGFAACEECDDTRGSVHPGAAESCNGIDDDCDGTADEDARWYPDGDGDGYGDAEASEVLSDCGDPPPGHVNTATDCDDSNPDIHPGETEVCDPMDIDEDCNGLSDDDDPDAIGKFRSAPDSDGDGYGDESVPPQRWCDAPSGLVSNRTDCDDTDASIHPGVSEEDVGLFEDPACDGGGGSLTKADYHFIGEGDDERAGTRVSTAGDVDGDGLDDLLVAAAQTDAEGAEVGMIYVILGRTLAAAASTSIDLGSADYALIGEGLGSLAGASMSAAGDVDGDGLDDLLLGDPSNEAGGRRAGAAYLILGRTLAESPSSSIDLGSADVELVGEEPGDEAGYSVSAAGDVDGDGLADLLVGAHRSGGSEGAAYLILGSTLAASTSTSIDLDSADFAFRGGWTLDFAGRSVSAAGDVDGDGLDDLLVGAPGRDSDGAPAGGAYLIRGSTLAASTSSSIYLSVDIVFFGERDGDEAGWSVSAAGDVDGDGLDDVLVGARYNNDGGTDAGKAYLFLGSTLAASASDNIPLDAADVAFIGERYGDEAAWSLSSAGDVDGDGLDDLFVGAQRNDAPETDSGAAYLILGSTLAASTSTSIDLGDADFKFHGESPSDLAGSSVSTAGDVNGDGRDDLLVGAHGNDEGGSDAGKAYLILSELE